MIAPSWLSFRTHAIYDKRSTRGTVGPPGAPLLQFLQGLQVLDQIDLLLLHQPEPEEAVVVLDNITQRRKAAVVEEAAFLVRPESGKRGGAVHMRRRPVGLKRVDADLAGRMQIVPRLGEERRNVAGRALFPSIEDFLPARRRHLVKTARRRLRRGDGDLIEMKSGQFRCDQVRRAP